MSNVEPIDIKPEDESSAKEVMRRPALREVRVVEDVIPILDTARFEHMQRIASVMADTSMIPKHITADGNPAANCFLIVNQAVRWGMDPFALAQHAYFVSGKLGWEGKVVAAAINSDPVLHGRLEYEFKGEGKTRSVVVSGTFKDTGKTAEITGTLENWKTANKNWTASPDQMLTYRGAREWARRHMPDRMLGVYSSDELEDMSQPMVDVTPVSPPDPPEEEEAPKPAGRSEFPELPAHLDRRNVEEATVVEDDDFDPVAYLDDLEEKLSGAVQATSRGAFDEIWEEHLAFVKGVDVPEDMTEMAGEIYTRLVKGLPA